MKCTLTGYSAYMLNIYAKSEFEIMLSGIKNLSKFATPFDLMLTLILIIYIDYKPRILIARVGEHAWIGQLGTVSC